MILKVVIRRRRWRYLNFNLSKYCGSLKSDGCLFILEMLLLEKIIGLVRKSVGFKD